MVLKTKKANNGTEDSRYPQSQPGLRYLRSPPCQALLPSRSEVTFLLCKPSDISTWLQHAWPGPHSKPGYDKSLIVLKRKENRHLSASTIR